MLKFVERRAELRKKVGNLEDIPLPSIQFRALVIQFWFETLGELDRFRTNKKVQLFCETMIKKLELQWGQADNSVDVLCVHFCAETDAEQVLNLIEFSFWVLGVIEKQKVKTAIAKLNLALQADDIPFEYVNGELLYRKR